jgi:Pilus formation protein N terminal region
MLRKLLVASLAAALSTMASAQEIPPTIDLKPGFAMIYRFDRAVRTVVIGNPDIIDATVQNDRSITLVAKRVGETNIVGLDDKGVDFFHATVLVGGGEIGRVQVHGRRNLREYTAYRCNQNGCQRLDDRFDMPPTLQVIPSAGTAASCQNPDDIAPDGTRCGDRAVGARPAGRP